MRKVKFEVLLKRVNEEQEKIIDKYGNENITCHAMNDVYADKKVIFGVNWVCNELASTEEARQFANRLNETIAVANSLNKEFEDCEIDFKEGE